MLIGMRSGLGDLQEEYSMRSIPILVLCLLVLLVLILPSVAPAQGPDELYRQWLRDFEMKLDDAEDVLRGKDASEWTLEEIDAYLFNALFVLYNANNLYIREHKQHPYDGEVLRNAGILTEWPGNPLRNWEPITWESLPGGFSPGDIAVQLCPPSEYSGYLREVPLTYVMSIYGPGEDYTPMESISSLCEWDIVLPGTAYSVSAYWEPAYKTRAKMEQTQQTLEELERDGETDADTQSDDD